MYSFAQDPVFWARILDFWAQIQNFRARILDLCAQYPGFPGAASG